ncbi:MAG: DEAD/DEAH box helicase [Chloroflexaceae bacterium]|jgi:DEAD/DEAH box helicase domain-containing protein|nr:DEAD/DEAH box helicase [Chloroflexaceae bacterium]
MTTDFAQLLTAMPAYGGQLVHCQPFSPRPARYAELAEPLAPALAQALAQRGVHRLYTHQAAAITAARAGNHVGVVTATASGKTLCYQLPAIEASLAERGARTLLLFPTKALAHDQLRSLQQLLAALPDQPLTAATLDGDTQQKDRDGVRQRAQLILSNPDMLHRTLLPNHGQWQAVLGQLRYVVIDEAHTYRGVFGSHVALIMRRLRRVCAHYGAAPQFILCSATSANPEEHLAALVGEPVQVIDDDGAPQGQRSFVLWNPPIIEARGAKQGQDDGAPQVESGQRRSTNVESGQRRSTNVETSNLLAYLVHCGVKTLAFTRSRRSAELVLRYTRETLRQSGSSHGERVNAYRAGYAPEERRRLERAFVAGDIQGMVSTNALELGVDIGGVDGVVMGGFPGTVASTWQQAGRAGRSSGASLAVLVAQDDPLDQFYMRHPEALFQRSHEHARVALENPYILADQLRCAAAELPLHEADDQFFGASAPALRAWLVRKGELAQLPDGRLSYCGPGRPAAQVNIRSADGATIAVRDSENGRLIEQVAGNRAPFEVYPGAIYLSQGHSYAIEQVQGSLAHARRVSVNYYTDTLDTTEIRVREVLRQRRIGEIEVTVGKVEVTRQVTAYRRKEHYTGSVLGVHDLDVPPWTFRTVAVWWTVPQTMVERLELVCDDSLDALHAMEHTAIGMLPLLAQCDRADIGGLSTNYHPDTQLATIFVYDGVPGGVGIAEIGFEQAEEWWERTRQTLADCPCADGCPACIQSPKCGNGNQHLSKIGAAHLSALLLNLDPPMQTPALTPTPPMPAARPSGTVQVLAATFGHLQALPHGPRRTALLSTLAYRIQVAHSTVGKGERGLLEQLAAKVEQFTS